MESTAYHGNIEIEQLWPRESITNDFRAEIAEDSVHLLVGETLRGILVYYLVPCHARNMAVLNVQWQSFKIQARSEVDTRQPFLLYIEIDEGKIGSIRTRTWFSARALYASTIFSDMSMPTHCVV